MNQLPTTLELAPSTATRGPLRSLGTATARGIDLGIAMIRIAQIARRARQDESTGTFTG